jgi:hypothetical protein
MLNPAKIFMSGICKKWQTPLPVYNGTSVGAEGRVRILAYSTSRLSLILI